MQKQRTAWQRFKSLVNTEGFQTDFIKWEDEEPFESLVNTEGFQTCEIWR